MIFQMKMEDTKKKKEQEITQSTPKEESSPIVDIHFKKKRLHFSLQASKKTCKLKEAPQQKAIQPLRLDIKISSA